MDEILLMEIKSAIERKDEQYLLDHKQDLIDNISRLPFSLSYFPESFRGDYDFMTAEIINGNVYELNDLYFVFSQATAELQNNPEFIKVFKDFEEFFKEQRKLLNQNRELGDKEALDVYYSALVAKKNSYSVKKK